MYITGLEDFRSFIIYLTEGRAYSPLKTEIVGISNVASGCLQVLIGSLMKLSQKKIYRENQSKKHINRGTKALTLGLKQLMPIALIGVVLSLGYRQWKLLGSNASDKISSS